MRGRPKRRELHILVRYVSFLCAVIPVVTCTGCATMIRGTSERLEVTSDPNGATVRLSNGNTGLTPCSFTVKRKHPIKVEYRKEGFVPCMVQVAPSASGGATMATFLGGLPGLLVDNSTGASYSLLPNPCHVKLEQLDLDEQPDPLPPVSPPVSSQPVPNPKIASRRWAVVIGVSRYADRQVPELKYAAKDARAFRSWLVDPNGGGYDPALVRLLCDEQATYSEIRHLLFTWLKKPIKEDLVTIYYAGHGSPESPDNLDNLFLLPHDVDYSNIGATGFPMWDVENSLKRFVKARQVVVIADVCHAAGVGKQFDIARRSGRGMKVNPIGKELNRLSSVGDSVCVLSAADESQLSQEGEKWGGGHGVFTYFLLQGLQGKADSNSDDHVTIGELSSYLSEHVRRATNSAQSPTVAGKFDPSLTIGK